MMLRLKRVLNRVDPRMARVFLPWALRRPRYLRAFGRLATAWNDTSRARNQAGAAGLRVPPFLILSITSRCNLRCAGCYAASAGTLGPRLAPDLNADEWRKVIAEASSLGVFGFVIAGGEPFLFRELVGLCREFENRFFLVFTNGTAIAESAFESLRQSTNIGTVVSVEGGNELTDLRRGPGTYAAAADTIRRLSAARLFTGISITINRLNVGYWLEAAHLDRYVELGIRLAFLIENVPAGGGCDDLTLNPEERRALRRHIQDYRHRTPLYVIHSPADEEALGGCVSAGRGFAHVTPGGDVTPCPVSNVATHNLRRATLREALASPLFERIRSSEHLLETEGVPCALATHSAEVDRLAESVGAYRTARGGL